MLEKVMRVLSDKVTVVLAGWVAVPAVVRAMARARPISPSANPCRLTLSIPILKATRVDVPPARPFATAMTSWPAPPTTVLLPLPRKTAS